MGVQIDVVIAGSKITYVDFLPGCPATEEDHSQKVTAFSEPLFETNHTRQTKHQHRFLCLQRHPSTSYEVSTITTN